MMLASKQDGIACNRNSMWYITNGLLYVMAKRNGVCCVGAAVLFKKDANHIYIFQESTNLTCDYCLKTATRR